MSGNVDFREALDSVSVPISGASGLPNFVYNTAEFFDIDRDEVLGRSWAAIGFGSDVPSAGCVKPINFMGVPLFVVRDKSDQIRVFHNVCSHRGMHLVCRAEQLRTVIRCPYHSWSYSFDGNLMSTPHIGGMDNHSCEGFDREDHGLKTVRFAVWMDIIFVNLSGDAESFADYIAPLEHRWSVFVGDRAANEFSVGVSGNKLTLDVNCNWKLAIENFCEAYHLPWVHPGLNTYSPLDQHYHILAGQTLSGQGTKVYELASVAGTQLPKLSVWPENKIKYAEYISLYPNTLLGLHADHMYAVLVLPEIENRSAETMQISYVGDGSTSDNYASCRKSVLESWDAVFKEDVFAVEGMQSGRKSPAFRGGVFTPVQDVPTHHYHCWIAERYREALNRIT